MKLRSQMQQTWKTCPKSFRTLYLLAMAIMAVYLILGLLTALDFIGTAHMSSNSNLGYSGPSWLHPLGTDLFGRDLVGRNLQALKTALFVGFFSSSLAAIVGTGLGTFAGFFRGWVDGVIRWVYTTIDSVPRILLIASASFVFDQGLFTLCMVLGLTGWVKLCRLVRGEVIRQKNLNYVEAARVLGVRPMSRAFLHILPNCLHIVVVQFGIFFVFAVKIEVILSFLGLGVEVGTPSWGMMISDARAELSRGLWWNLVSVTVFMFFLIFSLNLLIDFLRRTLNPRSKAGS